MSNELKSLFGQTTKIEPLINENTEKKNKEEEEKKMKEYYKKQNGMKKELIKLLGGIPAIKSTNTRKILMKGEVGQEWVWSMFNNQARNDGLKLCHWQRKEDTNKDYEFAYCNNNKMNIVDFTFEEYNSLIKPNDNNWSYEETVYLWGLLSRFDLRFTVVYDRYDDKQYQPRTVDELKDRYYSISRKILEQRKINDHPILRNGYNYEQEIKRRVYLERSLNRSNEEINNEAHLLKQASEIEKKLNKYEKLEESLKSSNFEPKPGSSFEEYIKGNLTENDSFVYLRSQKMKPTLPIPTKMQNKVDSLIKELNIPEKLVPTVQVEVAFDSLRNNLVFYTSLKKYLEKKEKEYILLDAKLHDLQNKKNQHHAPIQSTNTTHDYDGMSVTSSRTKEKKIKNANTPVKTKKRKTNDVSELMGSSAKKTKKNIQK